MKRWAWRAAHMEKTRNTRKLLIGRENVGEQGVDETTVVREI
jgi:hypothetical protein